MLAVTCPHCQGKFTAPPHAAGQQANCPACKQNFLIPGATIPALASINAPAFTQTTRPLDQQTPVQPEQTPDSPSPPSRMPPTSRSLPAAQASASVNHNSAVFAGTDDSSTPMAPSPSTPQRPPIKHWFVVMPDNTESGPLTKSQLNAMVESHQLNSDCQVLCEGWSDWKWAHEVFPELGSTTPNTEFQEFAVRDTNRNRLVVTNQPEELMAWGATRAGIMASVLGWGLILPVCVLIALTSFITWVGVQLEFFEVSMFLARLLGLGTTFLVVWAQFFVFAGWVFSNFIPKRMLSCIFIRGTLGLVTLSPILLMAYLTFIGPTMLGAIANEIIVWILIWGVLAGISCSALFLGCLSKELGKDCSILSYVGTTGPQLIFFWVLLFRFIHPVAMAMLSGGSPARLMRPSEDLLGQLFAGGIIIFCIGTSIVMCVLAYNVYCEVHQKLREQLVELAESN